MTQDEFEKMVKELSTKKFRTKKALREFCDQVYQVLVAHGHRVSIEDAVILAEE